jgi:hypothetical protein
MKILLLVLGGAWFSFALLFMFALVAGAKRSLSPEISANDEPIQAAKPVTGSNPSRKKSRRLLWRPAPTPEIIRNAA